MSNLVVLLDVLVVLGVVVSAILACHFENLLSAVISLAVTGIFCAGAFLVMHAPDVASGHFRGRCRRRPVAPDPPCRAQENERRG